MNKTLALIPVVIAIFALMISPAVMFVSAEKGGNGQAQGDPKGCDNGKGKDDVKNPNCSDTNTNVDTDGDGIPDSQDECPNEFPISWIQNKPDHDGDGIPDSRDSDTVCRF
ncbi:MAG: hypothetical protein HQ505_01265 [Nitrosopumilus sp.]|nr:hypothetical protein [Nitrosopumilus sp.]